MIALISGIEKDVLRLIYGISYFFTEFGPNATTFVYPAEVFPAGTRRTGHGIASATGKIGAFVGVFLFPTFITSHGLAGAEIAAGAVSVVGPVVTVALLLETKGNTLEELNEEAKAGAVCEAPRCERCRRSRVGGLFVGDSAHSACLR